MDYEKFYSEIRGIDSAFGRIRDRITATHWWMIDFDRRGISLHGTVVGIMDEAKELAWKKFHKAMLKWEKSHTLEEKYTTLYPDIKSYGVRKFDNETCDARETWHVDWSYRGIWTKAGPFIIGRGREIAWLKFDAEWQSILERLEISMP